MLYCAVTENADDASLVYRRHPCVVTLSGHVGPKSRRRAHVDDWTTARFSGGSHGERQQQQGRREQRQHQRQALQPQAGAPRDPVRGHGRQVAQPPARLHPQHVVGVALAPQLSLLEGGGLERPRRQGDAVQRPPQGGAHDGCLAVPRRTRAVVGRLAPDRPRGRTGEGPGAPRDRECVDRSQVARDAPSDPVRPRNGVAGIGTASGAAAVAGGHPPLEQHRRGLVCELPQGDRQSRHPHRSRS